MQERVFPENMDSPIGICSDHAGYELKEYIINLMKAEGIDSKDYGCFSEESCDYPDFAHQLGYAIDSGKCKIGIAICGTGNGINMTLNKHQKVRSALCWKEEIAFFARSHNNANVVTLPGRVVTHEEAIRILKVFFETEFEGGRHQGRIDKIAL